MIEDSLSAQDRQIGEFIRNLSGLDDGERARLKRNAGKSIAESHQAQLLFYRRVLPRGVAARQEEPYFLIATLYPLDKGQRNRDRRAVDRLDEPDETTASASPAGGSFGASFRRARTEQNQTGLDRRFARLLDAAAEDLPFQLRQAVMRLANEDVFIDWPQLTRDILRWNQSERRVQRRWARDYVYAAAEPQNQQPQTA